MSEATVNENKPVQTLEPGLKGVVEDWASDQR